MADNTVVYSIKFIGLDNADKSIKGLIARNKELVSTLKEIPAEGTPAYEKLNQEILDSTGGMTTLSQRTRQLSEEFSRNNTEILNFNRELKRAASEAGSINDIRDKLLRVNQQLDATKVGTKNFRDLLKESQLLNRTLQDLEQSSGRFQRNVGNYPDIARNISSAFREVGSVFIAAFSIANIINLGERALSYFLSTARSFSKEMANVRAISQATDEDFAALTEEAKRLGEVTALSATQAAQGMVELAKAGFNVREIIASIEPILNLAVAANVDLAQAADLTATVLRTYALDAAEAGRVTDIISRTITSSKTDLTSFQESFKILGPSAAAMGVSLEEASAAIGLLGDRGLTGTEATTTLSSALVRLAAQPKPVRDEMRALDIQIFDSNGQFVGLANLIDSLTQKYKDFTPEQIAASTSALFGLRAYRQFNVLLTATKNIITEAGEETFEGAEALRKYTDQIRQAGNAQGGFTQKLADTQLDSYSGALILLESATEGLSLALFDIVEEDLKAFILSVRDAVSLITQFAKGNTAANVLLERYGGIIAFIVKVLVGLKVATIAYNVAQGISNSLVAAGTRATALYEGVLRTIRIAKVVATRATIAYNTATSFTSGVVSAARVAVNGLKIALGPIGVLLTGISVAWFAVSRAMEAAERKQSLYVNAAKNLAEINNKIATSFEKERVSLSELFVPLLKTTEGTIDRKNAVDKLNSVFPELLSNYNLEKLSSEELIAVYDDLEAALLRQTVVRQFQEIAAGEQEKILQNTLRRTELEKELTAVQERKLKVEEAARKAARGGIGATPVTAFAEEGRITSITNELNTLAKENEIAQQNLASLGDTGNQVLKNLTETYSGYSGSLAGLSEEIANIGLNEEQKAAKAIEETVSEVERSVKQLGDFVRSTISIQDEEEKQNAQRFIQNSADNIRKRIQRDVEAKVLTEADATRLLNELDKEVIANRKKQSAVIEKEDSAAANKRLEALAEQADKYIFAQSQVSEKLLEQQRVNRLKELISQDQFYRLSAERQLALIQKVEDDVIKLRRDALEKNVSARKEAEEKIIQELETTTAARINAERSAVLQGLQGLKQALESERITREDFILQKEELEQQHSLSILKIRLQRSIDVATILAGEDSEEVKRLTELKLSFDNRIQAEKDHTNELLATLKDRELQLQGEVEQSVEKLTELEKDLLNKQAELRRERDKALNELFSSQDQPTQQRGPSPDVDPVTPDQEAVNSIERIYANRNKALEKAFEQEKETILKSKAEVVSALEGTQSEIEATLVSSSDRISIIEKDIELVLKSSLDVQRDLLAQSLELRLQEIEATRVQELALEDDIVNREKTEIESRRKLFANEQDYQNALEASQINHTSRVRDIEARRNEARVSAQQAFNEDLRGLLTQQSDIIDAVDVRGQIFSTNQLTQDLRNIEEALEKGLITREEYLDKIEQAEEDHKNRLIQLEIETLEARLSLFQAGSLEALNLQKQIADLELELIDGTVNATKEGEEEKQKAIEETRKSLKESLDQTFSALQEITKAVSDAAQKRKDEIDGQIEKRNEELAKDKEAIELQSQRIIQNIESSNKSEELKDLEKDKEIARKEAILLSLEEFAKKETDVLEVKAQAEEARLEKIKNAEEKLQAARDLAASIQIVNENLKALAVARSTGTIVASELAQAAAKGTTAVAEQAKLPPPANLVAIVATIAAIASGIVAIKRLFAEEGGLITGINTLYMQLGGMAHFPDKPLYMAQGGPVIKRVPVKRSRYSPNQKVVRVPRGVKIRTGKPHHSGGLLTELERGEFVQPVAATKMFLPQLQWMADQGNKRAKGKPYQTVFPSVLFPTEEKIPSRKITKAPAPYVPSYVSRGYAAAGGEAIEGASLVDSRSLTEMKSLIQESNRFLSLIIDKLQDVEEASGGSREIILSLKALEEAQAKVDFRDNIINR